jgi:hypothetical protein
MKTSSGPAVVEDLLASLQFPHIGRTEPLTAMSDRVVRQDDPSLGEKIVDPENSGRSDSAHRWSTACEEI